MALSSEEIKRIHTNKLASPNKKYFGADGYIYIGQQNGRLLKNVKSDKVDFDNVVTLDESNVKDALLNLNERVVENTDNITLLDNRVTKLESDIETEILDLDSRVVENTNNIEIVNNKVVQLEYDVVAYSIALGGL